MKAVKMLTLGSDFQDQTMTFSQSSKNAGFYNSHNASQHLSSNPPCLKRGIAIPES